MFTKMLAFEWRFFTKQPSFIVTSLLFFILPFLAISIDGVQIGTNSNVNLNSPHAVTQALLIFGIFGMFLAVNFIGNTALRDSTSNMDEILYCKPLPALSYQLGRFFGSYLLVLTVFSMVPLGLMIGSLMPWVDQEKLGALNIMYFLQPFFIFSITTMLILSAIFYAAAVNFRSIMAVYLTALGLFIIYISVDVLFDAPDERYLLAVLDPFGVRTYFDVSRYWTLSERNSQIIGLEAEVVVNRIIWLSIAVSFLFGLTKINKPLRLPEKTSSGSAKTSILPKSVESFAIKARYTRGVDATQLFTRIRFEVKQIFLSPSFILLMIFCFISLFSQLLGPNTLYGAESWPLTHIMVTTIGNAFGLILVIIITFYTAEAVWRDYSANMGDIVDSMPVKNSTFWLSKLLAVCLVISSVFLIGIVFAIAFQVVNGYFGFELYQYIVSLFYFNGLPLIYLCILSFLIQTLSPNKYVGMLIFVGYFFSSLAFGQIGIEHNMFKFSYAPFWQYSDMNGYGWALTTHHYYMLYWGALSLVFAVFSYALWRRGSETSLVYRLNLLSYRLDGAGRFTVIVATLAFVCMGTVIHYNTKVVNDFEHYKDVMDRQAQYEKKYKYLEDADLPTITAVDINAALFPEARKIEVISTFTLENKTKQPIERFLVNLPRYSYDIVFEFDEGYLEIDEEALDTAWFALNEPMLPGQQIRGNISLIRQHFGFKDRFEDNTLVKNGTFINNMELLPVFGVNPAIYLQDKYERRKRDLPPPKRAYDLEDESRHEQSIFGPHVGLIDFKARLSTDEDQIAIAPGYLKKYWSESGRNHFVYEMDSPMMNFFSIVSADLEVKSTQYEGIDIAVYYHKGHAWNVDVMIDAVKDSITFFSEAFGPYQHKQLRVIEFPGYRSFAQSFANTVPYSERIGFISDLRDKDVIDPVYYITAHEVAHQWFGHQLSAANVQGAAVLSESLSQYAALQVMLAEYGETKIRQFLTFELDSYLSGRTQESVEEMPLMRVENQDYIQYRKGSVVMMAIADRMGYSAMNQAIKNVLERHKFSESSYPTSLDLLNELKAYADVSEHDFIDKQFTQITLYDIKVSDASLIRQTSGNKHRINLSVNAQQYIASGNGDESMQAFEDYVDIVVFETNPEDFAEEQKVIYRKKHKISSGDNLLSIEVFGDPQYVAVDPFIRFIDRESRDNVYKLD